MAFRMQTPWKNPRSDKLWFRRRVPAHLVAFMGRREIKFSLGTADPELARIRFQEENAKLERMWHEHLNGRQYVKLSQRQISALAGEFYREMVFRHRDDPGKPLDWELVLKRDREKIAKRFPLQGRAFHMRLTFGAEAGSFLERKGYHLSGDTLDLFIEEFVFPQGSTALLRSGPLSWRKGRRQAFPEDRRAPRHVDQERRGRRHRQEGGSQPWLAAPLLFARATRGHARRRPEHHPGTRR
jgi:hypothetical protein